MKDEATTESSLKKIEEIIVNKLPITLVQFLKWAGLVGTGGEAKELIKAGLVFVNEQPCLIYGKQLEAGDCICMMAIDFKEAAKEGQEEQPVLVFKIVKS